MFNKSNLIKIEDFLWEIPKSFRDDMRVPARIYTDDEMLDSIAVDKSLEQLVNVATLPGIKGYALAMPDIHEGYGFPVGGVAAFDSEEGVISPGGIGYDINCGVRLLRSEKTFSEVKPNLRNLGRTIYHEVPSGVGVGGRLDLKGREFDMVLEKGAERMLELGYGEAQDLEHIESGGVLHTAAPELVSVHAKSRGRDQLGTMGAGNHFVEVGIVETIFDNGEAEKLNIFKDQVTVLIHTGSRGLGHQIATDIIPKAIDELPVIAVAACFAEGETIITDAKELRVKETDRIKAMTTELKKLGAEVEELDDGMIIKGKENLIGGKCSSWGDHRVAMALAVAGTRAKGTTVIDGGNCVSVSFPGFFDVMKRLRG